MVTFTWHACKYKVHKLHHWYILSLLLCLCYVFQALINSLVYCDASLNDCVFVIAFYFLPIEMYVNN